MGILAEQRDKDVEALTWVAARSFHAWDDFKRSHSRPDGCQIQLNDALIPALSDVLENEIVFQRGNPENTPWEIDFGNTAE